MSSFFVSFLLAKDWASHRAPNRTYCIDLVMSITTIMQIHIQILADSVVSDTNRFINFWLQSFDTKRETQIIKAYANHTMMTPPLRAAHLVFKISIHLCWSRSEKLNCYLQRSTSTNSEPYLLCMTLYTLQPHFCLGVYYDRRLSYPFCVGVRLHHLTTHIN